MTNRTLVWPVDVIRVVSEVSQLPADDIMSKCRQRTLCVVRGIYGSLAMKHTICSQDEVAKAIGRCHTSLRSSIATMSIHMANANGEIYRDWFTRGDAQLSLLSANRRAGKTAVVAGIEVPESVAMLMVMEHLEKSKEAA